MSDETTTEKPKVKVNRPVARHLVAKADLEPRDRKLAHLVLEWWSEHNLREHNLHDEEPDFVTLAKKILKEEESKSLQQP